jgi:hypothetical protein
MLRLCYCVVAAAVAAAVITYLRSVTVTLLPHSPHGRALDERPLAVRCSDIMDAVVYYLIRFDSLCFDSLLRFASAFEEESVSIKSNESRFFIYIRGSCVDMERKKCNVCVRETIEFEFVNSIE